MNYYLERKIQNPLTVLKENLDFIWKESYINKRIEYERPIIF